MIMSQCWNSILFPKKTQPSYLHKYSLFYILSVITLSLFLHLLCSPPRPHQCALHLLQQTSACVSRSACQKRLPLVKPFFFSWHGEWLSIVSYSFQSLCLMQCSSRSLKISSYPQMSPFELLKGVDLALLTPYSNSWLIVDT